MRRGMTVLLNLCLAMISQAQLPPNPNTYCRGILARQSVTLSGGILIDSFNSLDPSQSTNGGYDPAKRADGGDVASAASGVNVITDTGNTLVYGHFLTSPSGSVTLSGNASVGSLAWIDRGSRGIQPGWHSNNFQVTIPDATLPGVTFANLRQTSGTVNGTNYTYVVTNGFYKSSSFSLSSSMSMCINGNVALYFPNGFSLTGQAFIYIAPGASLTLYLGGQSSIAGQGTVNGTGIATNCSYVGLPACSSIQYSGGSLFIGTIYAPQAAVTLTGGGSQPVNFAGALVADTVKLTGNFQFHFDQSLCGGCVTPLIVTPPASPTVCPGSTVTFNVVATGINLSFQWYKDNLPLPGQSSSTLILPHVNSSSAGSYRVAVRTPCGTAVTNTASLAINTPVSASPPTSLTNCPGTTAMFSTTPAGTGPFNIQWFKNGFPVAGQTNGTLTLSGVIASDAASYSIVVNGACGSVTNGASLTVNTTVSASTLANLTNCPGTSATFSTVAAGTGPFSYVWKKSGTVLSNQTGSSLVLPNLTAAEAGPYSVIVGGACGAPVTNNATLVVNATVNITATPTNQTVVTGSNAVFIIAATGTGLNYQWSFRNTLLPAATNSSLNLSSVTTNNAGTYCVVVSGACGAPQTNCATLTVNVPVSVLTPPLNQTACPGTTVVFNEAATGTALNYQWYFKGNALNGQTTSMLTLTNVSFGDAGNYCVVASGAAGGPLTNCAALTVNTNVIVATAPASSTNCPGSTAAFIVNATGTSLSYQWYKGTGALTAQTNSFLTLTNVSGSDAGIYSVVVSGACGAPVTNCATLVVNTSVNIATPPTSQTTVVGSNAVFSIGATGTSLRYQWFFGTASIPSATNNSLNLSSVTTNSAGTYCVVVSGTCGAPQTNCVTLTVNTPVTVLTPPVSQTACPGTAVVFNESATGTALTYQWYFQNAPLNGQTNSVLSLSNVSLANAGTYCMAVNGAAGSPLTNCATLTVNTSVMVITAPAGSTNCPGSTAVFSVNATGTSLAYQWYKGATALPSQTNNTLTLASVSALDAATYSVIIRGACGSITNSAILVVNQNASVTPLSGVTRNIGGNVSFTVVASGTGPFSYVWKKNGGLLGGQNGGSLTLTNLTPADGGTYSTEVSGACGGTATSAAVLTINQPPTAAIINPTNNAVFVAPATFTLLADAADPDGTIGNVEFFQSTNNLDFQKIGETTVAPYFLVLTNLATNRYTFIARATDNLGAVGTSAPVNVSVIERPPLSLLGGIAFNPQNGLFQLTNVVFNPTYSIFNAVRVYVYGISNPIVVVNATGTSNGVPYVQSAGPILPGTAWTNTIKFFVPLGAVTPNPRLVPELVLPAATTGNVTNGTGQRIARGTFLRDRTFMVEFVTKTNQHYHLQFSSDLINWTTVRPAIPGNGTTIQWIDAGPPETDSLPALCNKRFYKILSTP